MLLAWCGPTGPGLFLGMFLAGLAGSPLHCGPMCGPFVLGQAADRLAAMPAARLCEMSRLRAGLLAPYHVGRLATYAALGVLAGSLGAVPGLGRLAGLLLLLGALAFLVQGMARLAPGLARRLGRFLPPSGRAPARWMAWIAATARRIDRRRWGGGLLLGLVLGFLPCGFLYAGLAIAAGAGGPERGGLAMLAFGAGTIPALVAIGWIGQAATRHWHRTLAGLAPTLMLINGALLAAAAGRAMLP